MKRCVKIFVYPCDVLQVTTSLLIRRIDHLNEKDLKELCDGALKTTRNKCCDLKLTDKERF